MGEALITRRGGGKKEGLYAYQKYGESTYEKLVIYGNDAYREINGVEDDIIDIYCVTGGRSSSFDEETRSLYISQAIVDEATLVGELNKGSTMDLSGNSSYKEYFCWKHGEALNTTQPILGNVYMRLASKTGNYMGKIDWTADIPRAVLRTSSSYDWIVCVDSIGGEAGDFILSKNILPHQQGIVRKVSNFWTDVLGFTKIAEDKFIPSSNFNMNLNSSPYTIAHSLGTKPEAFILYRKPLNTTQLRTLQFWFASHGRLELGAYAVVDSPVNKTGGYNHIQASNNTGEDSDFIGTEANIQLTTPSVSYSSYLLAGVEYTLITMA